MLTRDTQMTKHFQGSAITLTHQTQQDVVCIYPRVTPAPGLILRQLQHSLCPGREIGVRADHKRVLLLGAESLHPMLHVARLQTQPAQNVTSDASTLAQKPQQEMLSADLRVMQPFGFLMGKLECPSCSIGKEPDQIIHTIAYLARPTLSPFPPSSWNDPQPQKTQQREHSRTRLARP